MAGCRPVEEKFGISQDFGENKTVYNSGAGHSGRDYRTPVGTPAVAIEDGTVIWADESWNFPGDNSEGGWISRHYFIKGIPGYKNTGSGRTIIVEHDDCLATYSHMSEFRVVRGQKVRKGQIVGLTGDTGIVTGPHLHFEIIRKPFNWYNGGFYGRVHPGPYTAEPFRVVTVQSVDPKPIPQVVRLNGVDVASWQKGIDFRSVSGDFVIVKVTGGTGYVNPEADAQIRSARAAGKLVGLYHFANDIGFEGQPANREAEFFLGHARKYLDDSTILVLDWEGHVTKQAGGNIWARDFLDHVKRVTGETPWLYANPNDLNKFAWATVAKNYPLWVAAYGTSEPFHGYASDVTMPAWAKPKPELGFKIAAWQYSGNGRLPGYAGAIDLNVFYGNRDTWRGYAQGGPVVIPAAPKPEPIKPRVHIVQPGESLSGLAIKYGTTVDAIRALNSYIKDPNYLAVGDRVTLPNVTSGTGTGTGNNAPSTAPGRLHIVKPGESLSQIAAIYGTTVAAIRARNAFIKDPNYLAVGDRISIPAGTAPRVTQVIVEPGDTLTSIANQFGVTVPRLIARNPGINPNRIEVGWVLNL